MKSTVICPVCAKTFSRVHTADKPPVFCSRPCANKGRLVSEETRAKHRRRTGRNHPNFKGEWVLTDKRTGHVRTWVWVPPELRKPYGLKKAYMLRSRYVWNQTHPNDIVGPRDHIHHRDHDTLNDSPENLEKLTPTQHAEHHFRLPRGPLSEAHKAALIRAKRKLPDRDCEACGTALTRLQINQRNRFCSAACHYSFRRGKARTGW